MGDRKRGRLKPANKVEDRQIHRNLLTDNEILGTIASFGRLVESSYGPNGRLKFLQTNMGGHVTITSSSSQIIHHLMGMAHPIMRLVMMAIKGHLEVFSDGGLAMAILLIRLVETSLKLDVPRSVILEVMSEAQDIITSYLTSNDCRWKIKINIGDMKTMLCLIRGVLVSKPVCRLDETDKEFLCTTLLKAFLQSVPTTTSSSEKPNLSISPIQYVNCEGSPVSDTRIINGVLLEAPELPTYTHTINTRNLKVALYNVSMAGDTDEWCQGLTTVVVDGMDRDLSRGVVEMMKSVVSMLVKEGVGLVACQKVIHPSLKRFLKEQGVYVIDRLSVLHITSVQRLTGARILSTFTTNMPSHWFGCVGGIQHTVMKNKSYLHLLPYSSSSLSSSSSPPSSPSSSSSSCPVTTLILCAPDETSLNELKTVCQSAISVLQGITACPYVVPGGGCLDTHLAWYLRWHARHCDSSCLDRVGCSRAQYVIVMDNVARCLETVAKSLDHDDGEHVTDSTNHHHWILPPGDDPDTSDIPSCMCGLVSRDQCEHWCIMGSNDCFYYNVNQSSKDTELTECCFEDHIMDLYLAKLTSIQTTFETAAVILRVKHLVSDG